MDDDALERLLTGSAPRTRDVSAAESSEIRHLAAAAELEARRLDRRRVPRVAVGAVIAAVLLGAAGTAAAVGMPDWLPWAQSPDGVYHYTLPSGAVCEQRIGNFDGADEEFVDVMRAIYAEVDVVAEADVDAAIREIREGENIFMGPNGPEPAGYGTDHYNADTEYDQAMQQAIWKVVERELRERGLEPSGGFTSYEGQGYCPGAQW